MRNAMIALTVMLTMFAEAQDISWWKVDEGFVKYELPGHWASDPFSTSSVCDCPGRINDNGEWDSAYAGMVVYPLSEGVIDTGRQDQVWSHLFVSDEDPAEVDYAGIRYAWRTGTFNGMRNAPTVWQLITTDRDGDGRMPYVVYFWAAPEVFASEKTVFEAILETFRKRR